MITPQQQLRSHWISTLLQGENTTRPFQSKPSTCGWFTPFLDTRRHEKSLVAACQLLHRQTTNLLHFDAEIQYRVIAIPTSNIGNSRIINSVRRVCTHCTTKIMHYDSCCTFLVDWLVKISFILFFLAKMIVRFIFRRIALRGFGNVHPQWSFCEDMHRKLIYCLLCPNCGRNR